MQFPKHEASLSLVHNDHLNYYSTVAQSVESGEHGYTDWVSEEQRQKAIKTDECWYIQWYPASPVGFCIMSAADLDVLIDHVKDF